MESSVFVCFVFEMEIVGYADICLCSISSASFTVTLEQQRREDAWRLSP